MINVRKYDLSQVEQKIVSFILAQGSQRDRDKEGWGVQEGGGNEKQRKD